MGLGEVGQNSIGDMGEASLCVYVCVCTCFSCLSYHCSNSAVYLECSRIWESVFLPVILTAVICGVGNIPLLSGKWNGVQICIPIPIFPLEKKTRAGDFPTSVRPWWLFLVLKNPALQVCKMVQSYCLLVCYEIVKLHNKINPVLSTSKRRLVNAAESQEWDQSVLQVRVLFGLLDSTCYQCI